MKDYRKISGVILGLLVFFSILSAYQKFPPWSERTKTHYQLLSDSDGKIKKLVIQYTPAADDIVLNIFRKFLTNITEDITVIVLCPDKVSFKRFRSKLGAIPGKLTPVFTGHKITCWSRDRWLALSSDQLSTIHLLAPAKERGSELWPNRLGDMLVSLDLQKAFPEVLTTNRSKLLFDGGDFVTDKKTVFVTPDILKRNPGMNKRKLEEYFRKAFGKKTVIMPKSPPHHAGMFMMVAGNGRVLVGDPRLAQEIISKNQMKVKITNPDFSEKTNRLFDAVAEVCRKNGYAVQRIPVVPDCDGRTYLTYLNVIIDKNDNEYIVYMPVYDGATELNLFAEKTWQQLGYKVIKVNCSNSYRHFGSLRCLVNIIDRNIP